MSNATKDPGGTNCDIGRRRGDGERAGDGLCTSASIKTNIAKSARRQGRYWFATIPYADWEPTLVDNCVWAKGQHERGAGGFEHWQCLFAFATKTSLATLKKCFPPSAVNRINKAP
jgi:hypothetical protein